MVLLTQRIIYIHTIHAKTTAIMITTIQFVIILICIHTLHPCLASMPCIHALHPCLASMPCIHALHPCLASMPCIHALHPCLAWCANSIQLTCHLLWRADHTAIPDVMTSSAVTSCLQYVISVTRHDI